MVLNDHRNHMPVPPGSNYYMLSLYWCDIFLWCYCQLCYQNFGPTTVITLYLMIWWCYFIVDHVTKIVPDFFLFLSKCDLSFTSQSYHARVNIHGQNTTPFLLCSNSNVHQIHDPCNYSDNVFLFSTLLGRRGGMGGTVC